MLEEMQASGNDYDVKAALLELMRHMSLTQQQVAAEDDPEAPTPFSDIGSRLSLGGVSRWPLFIHMQNLDPAEEIA